MRILIIITTVFITFNSFAQSTMKAIAHTPTNKLENSVNFYQKLGFKVVSEDPLIYTDGKLLMEVNSERSARPGIKLFKTSWAGEITKLKELCNPVKLPSGKGYLLYDPSGVAIYLMEYELNIRHQPADSSFSHLGNLAGLTLETGDIKKSFALYEALGFTKTMGDADKGFVSLTTPDKFGITLLSALNCPHLFFNPSITYFNGKNNSTIIKKIMELNIPVTEEVTGFSKDGSVDNIIIRDPGGYGFFLFND